MATPRTAGRRILVVDDEPMVADSIKVMLALDGHEVVAVASAEEALALLSNQRFDLIITDYELPRMKGNELAAAIKKLIPNQPVALVTAYGETLSAERDRLSGVDLVINKPFEVQVFRRAVARLTSGQSLDGPDLAA
jgi:CheY-like chemotaxis protein